MRGISSRPRAAAPTEGLNQTTRNLKSAAVAADFFIADLIVQRRYVPHLPPCAAPYHCVPTRARWLCVVSPSGANGPVAPLIRTIGVCVGPARRVDVSTGALEPSAVVAIAKERQLFPSPPIVPILTSCAPRYSPLRRRQILGCGRAEAREKEPFECQSMMSM